MKFEPPTLAVHEKVIAPSKMHNYIWWGVETAQSNEIWIPGFNDTKIAWFWTLHNKHRTTYNIEETPLSISDRMRAGMFLPASKIDIKRIDYKCQPITKLAMKFNWFIGPSCQGHFPTYDSLMDQWKTIMQIRVDMSKHKIRA